MGKVRSSGTVLFVIALVALTTAASAIWIYSPAVAQSGQESWAVKGGDNLTYEVSGHRDGAPVTGIAYSNFTEVNIAENLMIISGYHSTDLGEWVGRGVTSALGQPSMGQCLGEAKIRTDFGTKYVTRYLSYFSGPEANTSSIQMIYAGVDSRVIYRINVSAPSFFLELNLKDATIGGLQQLDRHPSAILPGAIRPTETDWTETFGSPGGIMSGVFDLPVGTTLTISVEGNGSRCYFFNEDDILEMENGGTLGSGPALTLDPPGVRTWTVEGDVCMLVVDMIPAVGQTVVHISIEHPS